MPPYGGFGGNTGVADAHNLAWKLAAVCRGDAPEELLDSYQLDRAPIAELTVAQALLRSAKNPGQPDPPDQIETTTQPGTRAAHVALTGGHSTLDLLDPTVFTLIGAPHAPAFEQPPAGARTRPVPPTDIHPTQQGRWFASYAGPNGDRATLVRAGRWPSFPATTTASPTRPCTPATALLRRLHPQMPSSCLG